jgi:hypothetical protein
MQRVRARLTRGRLMWFTGVLAIFIGVLSLVVYYGRIQPPRNEPHASASHPSKTSPREPSGNPDTFLAQEIAFEPINDSPSMRSFSVVTRPSFSFSETAKVVFPPSPAWGGIEEKRINRNSPR